MHNLENKNLVIDHTSLLTALPIEQVFGPLAITKEKIDKVSEGLEFDDDAKNIASWFSHHEQMIVTYNNKMFKKHYKQGKKDIVQFRGQESLATIFFPQDNEIWIYCLVKNNDYYNKYNYYSSSDQYCPFRNLKEHNYIQVDKLYGNNTTNNIYISTTDKKPRWYKWVGEPGKYTRISEEERKPLELYEIGKLQHIPVTMPTEEITLGDDTYPAGTLQYDIHTQNWEMVQGNRGKISIGKIGEEAPSPTIHESYKNMRLQQARGVGDYTVVEMCPTALVKQLLGKIHLQKNTYLLIDATGTIVASQQGLFTGEYLTVTMANVSYLFPCIDKISINSQRVQVLIDTYRNKTIEESLTFEESTPMRTLLEKLQKMFRDLDGNNIVRYGKDDPLLHNEKKAYREQQENNKTAFRTHMQKMRDMYIELLKNHPDSPSLKETHTLLIKLCEKISTEAHETELLWEYAKKECEKLSADHPLRGMIGNGFKTIL